MRKKLLAVLLFLICINAQTSAKDESAPVFYDTENAEVKLVNTNNSKQYFEEYKKLKKKNKNKEAYNALHNAYLCDKTDYEILSELIKYLLDENKPNEAVKYFEQSLLANPEFESSPEVLSYMSKVYVLAGDLKSALKYQLRAIELNKDNKDYYTDLGKIYLEQGKWLNAINAFEFAISNKDKIKDSQCYNYIGIVNVKRKNYTRAIENFEESIKLNENFANLTNLAKTYKAKGENDKYIAILNKVQTSYMTKAGEFYYIAKEYSKYDKDEALEIANEGLKLFPDNSKLRELAQKLQK